MENYNVDYFIKKFEAIPDELIIPYERHAGDKHEDKEHLTRYSFDEL